MTDAPAPEEAPKVLQFTTHREPGRIKLKPVEYEDCRHRQLTLDYDGRAIWCTKCKKMLDPFHALKLVQGWMSERDYKYEAVKDYEKRERERRQREYERRMKKEGRPIVCRICAPAERHLCTGYHCDVCGAITAGAAFCNLHGNQTTPP